MDSARHLLGLQLPGRYPVEPYLAIVDRRLGIGKDPNAGDGRVAWKPGALVKIDRVPHRPPDFVAVNCERRFQGDIPGLTIGVPHVYDHIGVAEALRFVYSLALGGGHLGESDDCCLQDFRDELKPELVRDTAEILAHGVPGIPTFDQRNAIPEAIDLGGEPVDAGSEILPALGGTNSERTHKLVHSDSDSVNVRWLSAMLSRVGGLFSVDVVMSELYHRVVS